jgi:HEAT repeat protein
VLGLAALVVLGVVGVAGLLWPRRVALGLSQHEAKRAREELATDVVALPAGGDCPAGGYEEYLELARARVASEETLGCLVQHQQPGVVDAFLRDLSFEDSEARVAERRRRSAVSLLAALGDPAVPSVCAWLRSPDTVVRLVAVRALAAVHSPAAFDCVREAASDPSPAVRASAATGLRLLISQGALDAPGAWALAAPLAADADPGVRQAAVYLLGMFDFDHAMQALAPLEKDGDPAVATLARGWARALRQFKNLNPDLPY